MITVPLQMISYSFTAIPSGVLVGARPALVPGSV